MPNSLSNTEIVRRLSDQSAGFDKAIDQLLSRHQPSAESAEVHARVAAIIDRVVSEGDAAVLALTEQFDAVELTQSTLEVDKAELLAAWDRLEPDAQDALTFAADRIRRYHERQMPESWQYEEPDGTVLGQKVTAVGRAGLYVPGGKATYPSSVLMNAIPAKVAGVKELIMVSPTPNGEVNEWVMAAAHIAGVDRVFSIGGAQAIAALAYGTSSVPKVDVIVGPGNIYVAAAKQQVFGRVGIDMLAGPSEVLILADDSANPEWVAMDLFAQAEHDEMAQSILVSTSDVFLDRVNDAITRLLPDMQRREIIESSLRDHGALVKVATREAMVKIADRIAAEHLEIHTENADELAERIQHAGAMFIGSYSGESLGDYCAGPSHVLPTSGSARFSSGLSVHDFLKRSSVIKVSARGAQEMGRVAARLAYGESLEAHARAALYRLNPPRSGSTSDKD